MRVLWRVRGTNVPDEHDHEDAPRLPAVAPPDRAGNRGMTCPFMLNDGTVCGEPMSYALNVREYHPVHGWTSEELVVGEANSYDTCEEENRHLWCRAGHDWIVPDEVAA